MKIGIVTTSYPRYRGDGAGVFVLQLVEALRALGHTVCVVAPEAWDAPPDAFALEGVNYAQIRPRFARRIAYGTGIVVNIRKNPLLLFGIPGFINSLERAAREKLRDCDVVDACFSAAGFAVARTRQEGQAKVYTGHGSDIHLLDRSRFYRRKFRKMLQYFDSVTTVSSYLAEKLRVHDCRSDARVIPNGVSEEAFSYSGEWPEMPCVIYASRLIASKRPLLLAQAWADVVERIPDARLVYYGDGPLMPELRDRIRELSLEGSVELRGQAPLDVVWTAMGRGWLTVLPSQLEGLPVGLLESLATGTPFLSSPAGGAPDIAKQTEGGRILPEPLTAAALSDALVEMLSNAKALREMGATGRKNVKERYSWESIAHQRLEMYGEAIRKARARGMQ